MSRHAGWSPTQRTAALIVTLAVLLAVTLLLLFDETLDGRTQGVLIGSYATTLALWVPSPLGAHPPPGGSRGVARPD